MKQFNNALFVNFTGRVTTDMKNKLIRNEFD